jgi:hypothetical protein
MEFVLFHADGRTDTTKLIVAFRNLAILFSQLCPPERSILSTRKIYAPLPHLIILALTTRKIFDEDYSGLFLCIVTSWNKFMPLT